MWSPFNLLRNMKGQMAIAPVLLTAVALGTLFQMRNIKLSAHHKEEVSTEEEQIAATLLNMAQVAIEQSFRAENSATVQAKLLGCPVHTKQKCFTLCDPRRQLENKLVLKRSGAVIVRFVDSLGANSCSEESLFHSLVNVGADDGLERNEIELVLEIPSRSDKGRVKKIVRFIRYDSLEALK